MIFSASLPASGYFVIFDSLNGNDALFTNVLCDIPVLRISLILIFGWKHSYCYTGRLLQVDCVYEWVTEYFIHWFGLKHWFIIKLNTKEWSIESFTQTHLYIQQQKPVAYVIGRNATFSWMHVWQRKQEIMIYKVLNMEMYRTQTHQFDQEAFIKTQHSVEYFLWWMDALFLTSIELLYQQLGRARIFLNITPIVFVWKKKVIYT